LRELSSDRHTLASSYHRKEGLERPSGETVLVISAARSSFQRAAVEAERRRRQWQCKHNIPPTFFLSTATGRYSHFFLLEKSLHHRRRRRQTSSVVRGRKRRRRRRRRIGDRLPIFKP
jgi:hypothetical protein